MDRGAVRLIDAQPVIWLPPNSAKPRPPARGFYVYERAGSIYRLSSAGVETELGAGGSLTVQDEGSSLATDATTLNFVGSGVTASGTGATKTITIPGGGGETRPLDTSAESSGNSRNDEFNSGPSIDAKWTLVGNAVDTVNVNSTVANRLYLRRNDTGSKISIYYQNVPTAPYDIYAKVDASTFETNFCRGGGIALLPATPTDASATLYLGFLYNNGYQIAAVKYSDLSTFSSTAASAAINAPGPEGGWFRFNVLSGSTTVDVYYSIDGYFWRKMISAYALGFTVTNAGVAFSPEGQATDLQAAWDWYRVA